ncbi:hypothetical protein THAOC_04145, partial [Thalassiosira oceanica]
SVLGSDQFLVGDAGDEKGESSHVFAVTAGDDGQLIAPGIDLSVACPGRRRSASGSSNQQEPFEPRNIINKWWLYPVRGWYDVESCYVAVGAESPSPRAESRFVRACWLDSSCLRQLDLIWFVLGLMSLFFFLLTLLTLQDSAAAVPYGTICTQQLKLRSSITQPQEGSTQLDRPSLLDHILMN